MGRDTRALALGLVLAALVCLPVLAQAQASTVRAVALKRAWDPIPVGDCAQPSLPQNAPTPWIAQVEDRLAWCVPGPTAAATASDYAAYIDGDKFPILKACLSTTLADVQCLAGFTPAMVAKLTPTGPHRIEVTRAVAGVESGRSVPVDIVTPGCNYTPPGGAQIVKPIGTAIGGPLTTGGLQGSAERIGQFRRDGWLVWPMWDSDSNTVQVMIWCAGTPQ